MKRVLSLILSTVLLTGCLTACGDSSASDKSQESADVTQSSAQEASESANAPESYNIALIAPFTGDNAQYGEAFKTGLTVLADEVNADGGINGVPLAFQVFDDAADAAQSTNMAQAVVGDEQYIAAIGSYSSTCTLAFAPIFDEAQMPVLVPCAGNSTIATSHTYTFQRGMTIPIESALMARYAVEKLGGTKVAFIALNNDAGLQFMENAKAEIEELKAAGANCETVAAETFNEGEVRDYNAMLLKIKEANPDIIVVNLGYVECAAILTQAQQIGLNDIPWLGNQSMYNEDFINLVGDAGKGFYVSTGFYAENPDEDIQDFVAKCQAVDGMVPNAYQRNAYECGAMIVSCLRERATTRQELYDALCAIDMWEGKTGNAKWINRQVEEEYLILQYKGDGVWEQLDVNN